MLICPICHLPLNLTNKTYQCANQHSFDVAKESYVNLHVVQHKKSKNPGDTPEAVQARRAFLSEGYYQPLKDAISKMAKKLNPNTVLDIGCGEGYYTQGLIKEAGQVIGLDIAKSAIQAAAKADKAHRITWVVGTGAVLPVADGSVDLCTSVFSPLPKDEMLRVLRDGGYLMVASAAPNHLYAMREALFGKVIVHEPAKSIQKLAPEFELIDQAHIIAPMQLDNTALKQLIAMTPYAYKAKADRRAMLESLEHFSVQGEFCLFVFQKVK
ncbi:putative RNA methyltransferase [Moraxella canis]|uniref:putative RNA methyltransferase n=1 Tax=Moraxella canis TaxID=90239 RepID=UPI000669474A|nr:methyltransferase domain-containing protein [Moraxella canis]